MPVVPEGARVATPQHQRHHRRPAVDGIQTPCVADLRRAVFDRRFLLEGLRSTRREIERVLAAAGGILDPRIEYALHDLIRWSTPHRRPMTPLSLAPCVNAVGHVLGRRADLVASPGTTTTSNVARIAGVPHGVAYGPGELEQAHQPDEHTHRRHGECDEGLAPPSCGRPAHPWLRAGFDHGRYPSARQVLHAPSVRLTHTTSHARDSVRRATGRS